MNLSSSEYDSHQQRLRQLSKIIYEYLLIISPDKDTTAALFEIKKAFRELYGCEYSANLTPHITLVNFVQFEANEKQFIYYFDRLSKSVNEFDIELNGFGQFPQHTIYVNVSTKKLIIAIVKRLKTSFGKFLRATEHLKPSFTLNPHLTIARNMTEREFERAWEEWKHREYNSSFLAHEMRLLKRNISGGKFETVAVFPFVKGGISNEQLKFPF